MKLTLGIFALLLATSFSAHAERWIVKNPHASLEGYRTVKTITFGNDTYLVVEAPDYATLGELNSFGEKAFSDLRIGVPADIRHDGTGLTTANDGSQMAWHVKALQYANLPAKFNGSGITVAVIDTGMDINHPNLKDHVWTNEKEIPGNGIDDDHNGYVDDVHGWNFEVNNADVTDTNGHGTHCSGVIAASPNAQNQAQGVAQGAKVMPVRIIGDKSVGFLSDAIAGIKYATDNGAKVLSNSWRVYKSWGDFDPSDENIELLKKAIQYVGEHGAVFVAAAGNESLNMDTDLDKDPMFPGGYVGINNFIVVAASDQTGAPAYFTNFGASHVSVAAPGVSIISTIPNNQWEAMSGTSMATPLIAGSVARGLSASYPAADIGDRLVNTSASGTGWDTKVRAKGVVDLMHYLTP